MVVKLVRCLRMEIPMCDRCYKAITLEEANKNCGLCKECARDVYGETKD